MKIEKIHNNADNHEVASYLVYAKIDHITFTFEKNDNDEILLYKDKNFKELVTKEDIKGIPGERIVIAGIDTTIETITYYKPTSFFCDENTTNVNCLVVVEQDFKTEKFVKQLLIVSDDNKGGNAS